MTAAPAAAALAPARAHMLRGAADQAALILADARRRQTASPRRPASEAERRVSQARARAERRRCRRPPRCGGRAQRDARSVLLGAQREAYDELRARVRAAVGALRDEPGYDRLLEPLARHGPAAAGTGATVTRHPSGGVVARAAGMVVDCSLPRLADLAVEALDGEVRELWTP